MKRTHSYWRARAKDETDPARRRACLMRSCRMLPLQERRLAIDQVRLLSDIQISRWESCIRAIGGTDFYGFNPGAIPADEGDGDRDVGDTHPPADDAAR